MSPLVSVILPTYNRAHTLERAISSVLKQTFSDFELIIMDDGSTDETSQVLDKYDERKDVRVIRLDHGGVSVARNTGIAASQGRYIAFQDSDDEWLPNFLEKAVAALKETGPEIGVFYCDWLQIWPDGKTYKHKPPPHVQPGVLISQDTLDYQVFGIGLPCVVIKRACFDKVGFFDQALPRLVDLDLFIRLSDHYQFIQCEEILLKKYLVRPSISSDASALAAARRTLLAKYRARLAQRRGYLAQQYLFLAGSLLKSGDQLEGTSFILRALLTSPYRVLTFASQRFWRNFERKGERQQH